MPPSTESPGETDSSQQAIAWLIKLRSDDLSEADQHSFADWLSQDAAHPLAFAEAETLFGEMVSAGHRLREKLGSITDNTDLPALNKPSLSYPPTKLLPKPAPKLSIRWLAVPLATAAVWLLAVFSIMPQQSHLFDAYLSDYHTRTGEIRDITLADGSRLLLNTNTAVSVKFSNEQRLISVQHGQARFTVAQDKRRPFEVESGGLRVRALGTVFEVYNPETDTIKVTVQEHAVSALATNPPAITGQSTPEPAVIIQAGQQLSYQSGKPLSTPVTVNIATQTAWQQRKLFISDSPLSELIAELNRYRTGRIYLGGGLANLRVSGVFSLADPDQTLHTISAALALRETRLGMWWVVLHR